MKVKPLQLIEFCSYGEIDEQRKWLERVNFSGTDAVATNGHLIVVMEGLKEKAIDADLMKRTAKFQKPTGEGFTPLDPFELPSMLFDENDGQNPNCMLGNMRFFSTPFRGATVQAAYIQVLATLPGIKFAPVLKPDACNLFIWAQGWGALMPIDRARLPYRHQAPWERARGHG